MQEISKAIIKVMEQVKGIEKEMTVGSGQNSYKGVSDQSVKKVIGTAMAENGLCIIPTGVKSTTRIDRWTEIDQYSKIQGATKEKQSVFTEVETKYLLLHTSGEHIELSGYGHGTDTQDKGAGKATTYALKYALLYTFLVPTGKIDDADTHHSDEAPVPAVKAKEELTPKHVKWQSAIQSLVSNKTTITAIEKGYILSAENRDKLLDAAMQPA